MFSHSKTNQMRNALVLLEQEAICHHHLPFGIWLMKESFLLEETVPYKVNGLSHQVSLVCYQGKLFTMQLAVDMKNRVTVPLQGAHVNLNTMMQKQ